MAGHSEPARSRRRNAIHPESKKLTEAARHKAASVSLVKKTELEQAPKLSTEREDWAQLLAPVNAPPECRGP